MAHENNGLPPEVHIDHWNEATNIYMVVVVVCVWFAVYFKRNGGRVRMLTRQEVVPEPVNNTRYQDEIKHVRLRQQLEHYSKARKWDLAKQSSAHQEYRIDMETI